MRHRWKKAGAIWLAVLMVVSGFAAMNPVSAQTDRGQSQAPGDDWVQTRLQMTHRPQWEPDEQASDEDAGGPPGTNGYIGHRGIYVNYIEDDYDTKASNADSSLRLYGQPGKIAPRVYSNPGDAFDPTVIPKDSATWNPALILNTDDEDNVLGQSAHEGREDDVNEPVGIRACGEDAHLKKNLRVWYEPGHVYHGPRTIEGGGSYEATVADAIQVESTYSFLDASSFRPATACESSSDFPFPTEGVWQDDDYEPEAHKQPGLDTMRMVHVESVSDGDSVQGTVELSREVTLTEDPEGSDEQDEVQFLDHALTFHNIVTDLDGDERARVTVQYAGNTFKDADTEVNLRERVCFDRANNQYSSISHLDPIATWCAELVSYDRSERENERDSVTIKVSKELSAGDVFYADGVRYEVPAVHTVDGELKYITLRTPIPKSDPGSGEVCNTECGASGASWTSATDPTRDEQIDGQFQLQDNSWVTTQWLQQVDWNDPIPVDPPFNHDEYRQVDDTDVQIWEPGEDNDHKRTFPWGPADDAPFNGTSGVGAGDGMPMFPEGERYTTQQNPPQEWIEFFDAEMTGLEDSLDDGSGYADNMPERFGTEDGVNDGAWRYSSTYGPPQVDHDKTDFFWIFEWYEERYTTNLLEVLERNFTTEEQSFTKYHIASHPDRYTEFVLPDLGDDADVQDEGNLTFADGCSRQDVVDPADNEGEDRDCQEKWDLHDGDYLVTTSLTLQDGQTRHKFVHDPDAERDPDRLWGDTDGLNDVDLYFNEIDLPGMDDHDFSEDTADTTVRLFGEVGEENHAPDTYDEYWMAQDPYAIPKDSATFNPALIEGDRELKACGEDIFEKKHLRAWYEPGHDYHGPRVEDGAYEATVGDAIQVESTYSFVDASNYRPVHACGNSSTIEFPTKGVHLSEGDGHEQPGLDELQRVQLRNVSDVSGDDNGTDGIVEVTKKIELEYGEMRQFLDHKVRFNSIVTDANTGEERADLSFWYLGNTFQDAMQSHVVGERIYLSRSNDAFDQPHHDNGNQLRTWFVEVVSFDRSDRENEEDSVTLRVGKELQQGDIFYVDGVRYEVPAIHVVPCQTDDACVKQITLRTPIPKSDPEGSWTSVTDPTREEFVDEQWQVQDNSVVTTQWLVEVDNKDPIPVDPPFNNETYTMVDDTDVQLWEQGEDNEEENFPWGEANESLPGGNGQPMWPQGERFLTDQTPPQAWIDHFDAEPTGYNDTGASYADSLPERTATAHGINHDAWEPSELTGPHEFDESQVNFTWVKEWYEGRYSTNFLEIPEGDEYVKEDIRTKPDRFTEFVLPDRPNPVSLTNGTLEFGDDPDCTRGDLFPNDVGDDECKKTYDLLGGDYLITTSLLLEWCGCEDPLEGRDGSTGDSGSSDDGDAGTADTHAYDTNDDCVLSDDEVLALVSDWGDGQVSDDTLLSGVAAWGEAPDEYC